MGRACWKFFFLKPSSYFFTYFQQIFRHFGECSLLKIFIRMRNINGITFPKRNQRNKKQLEIPFVNSNHSIHLKTVSHDFAVIFSDWFFIESKDEEKHLKYELRSQNYKILEFSFHEIENQHCPGNNHQQTANRCNWSQKFQIRIPNFAEA